MKVYHFVALRENVEEGSFSYEPKWNGAIEGYVVRTLNKNFWRFSDCMEFDDAYQEAYIKFMELKKAYFGMIDCSKWFMSLFKTSLANKITDLANLSNRLRRQVCFTELGDQISSDGESVSYADMIIGSYDTEAEFEHKIENAPEEIRKVFKLLLTAPPHLLAAMTDTWNARGKRKEGGNQFLCSMLGYDPRQVDLVEAVRYYLEEEE
jgi:hypothetical protein